MEIRRLLAIGATALCFACGEAETPTNAGSEAGQALRASVSAAEWEEMIAAEEVLHALSAPIGSLARATQNLQLPDPTSRELFAIAVEVEDLGVGESTEEPVGALGAATRELPVDATPHTAAARDLSLWRPLFDAVAWIEHASFGTLSARFTDPERTRFTTELAFSAGAGLPTAAVPTRAGNGVGHANETRGGVAAIKARVEVVWERRPGDDVTATASWRIVSWRTRNLTLQTSERPFFREVLSEVLPSADAVARARASAHEELVIAKLADPDGFVPPHPHFFQGSQDRHPGVSVVDINGDDLDDVYVMARWGPNRLYLNRGDGQFDERAAEFGLDLRDHSAAAIFADFDNDGDPDAFVARTLAPSVYLENDAGRFRDRSEQALPDGAPLLASSVSAADVNADGLLDLYVSTYAAQMLVAERLEAHKRLTETGRHPDTRLLGDFLEAGDAERLFELAGDAQAHQYLALPGPPNVLLLNAGGGVFREQRGDSPLRAFRNTYQATWSDYDDDGDPDVYLAHDFAPNQLLRNDGAGGFEDVTAATGTADIGFGMGASFGDYDADGRQDLYVSNMFSKAGLRITNYFEAGDSRLRKMARGNTLFRNTEEGFEQVSGLAAPDLQVEKAGWSWGGQWTDIDNDGLLDIAVLSGYYTAPGEIESLVDI